jgi:twitching motility two-component system response regulator PilG
MIFSFCVQLATPLNAYKHSAFQETPIIMVTGNTSILDRAKAKVAGATDYLTKPFS